MPEYNKDDYPHPGSVLLTELEKIGLSQRAFAHFIGVKTEEVTDLCSCKVEMTARMALKISRALGTPPRQWMELQTNHSLVNVDKREYEDIRQLGAPLEGEEEEAE